MNQTDLDLDPLRSLSEAAFVRTEMDIRSILSHELVVGDYLGVISSLHHPEHFRRVEKLEYVDADLGRRHLRNDVFYLEAAGMGPVIAWCHGIAAHPASGRRAHLARCARGPADGGREGRVLGSPQWRG
jgi:hypothetical protein